MERREAPGACETPCRSLRGSGIARLTNGVATPVREARRQTSNGFAKPAERALRLPALHRPTCWSAPRAENLTPACGFPACRRVMSAPNTENDPRNKCSAVTIVKMPSRHSRHPEVAAQRPSKGDGNQVGYSRLGQ